MSVVPKAGASRGALILGSRSSYPPHMLQESHTWDRVWSIPERFAHLMHEEKAMACRPARLHRSVDDCRREATGRYRHTRRTSWDIVARAPRVSGNATWATWMDHSWICAWGVLGIPLPWQTTFMKDQREGDTGYNEPCPHLCTRSTALR